MGLSRHTGAKREHRNTRVPGVAVLVHQWHPAPSLLLDLSHSLVLQQVGQQHLVVAHSVTELQVIWDVHTLRRLVVDTTAIVQLCLPGIIHILRCLAQQDHWHYQDDDPPKQQRCKGLHCELLVRIPSQCSPQSGEPWVKWSPICLENEEGEPNTSEFYKTPQSKYWSVETPPLKPRSCCWLTRLSCLKCAALETRGDRDRRGDQ